MIDWLSRLTYKYRMLDYPDVPDFLESPRPMFAIDAHLTRLDVVRAHNLRAIKLWDRAFNLAIFGIGVYVLGHVLAFWLETI